MEGKQNTSDLACAGARLKTMIYNVILIGGCVDEFVINELTKLSRDFDPEFVVRIAAPMLCGDSNVLSDSRFDGGSAVGCSLLR